jgi:hypothetical protein
VAVALQSCCGDVDYLIIILTLMYMKYVHKRVTSGNQQLATGWRREAETKARSDPEG